MSRDNGTIPPGEYVRQFIPRQTDFAKRAGWSTAYVSDLLAGKRQITAKKANKIAAVLKMSRGDRQQLHRLGALAEGWEI